MLFKTVLLVAFTTHVDSSITRTRRQEGGITVTPHEQYSSSIGALGCKLNTNRVAYWPEPRSEERRVERV